MSFLTFEDKLAIYKSLLCKWNPKLNLVAASTLADIENRHFADSLQLAKFIPKHHRVVDIGSGAGFPGMVLALYGYDVILVEVDEKKCVFLRNVSRETNTDVEIVTSRVESFQPDNLFDAVTSRGVAPVADLIKLTSHLIQTGKSLGYFLKGERVAEEIKNLNSEQISLFQSDSNPESNIVIYKY